MIQINDNPTSGFNVDSEPGAELGPLVLRIHGADCDGQVVRLQSPKCTIGADPRCTLRLDTEGVRPVHCLVIRGDHATVVRRWSDDTRLNGSAFSDTELVPGDRLGAGPVDLEILEVTGPTPSLQAPQTQESKEFTNASKFSQKLTLTRREGQRRAKRLLDQLREAREQIGRLQAELQSFSQKDAQRQTQHEVFAESQKHCERREAELDEDRRQLDAGRADLDVRQSEFEKKLSQWEQEAEARQEQWRRQEREFQAKRERWEAKHREIETHLTQWQNELDARESQFSRQHAPAAEPATVVLHDRRGAGPRPEASAAASKPADALGVGEVSILDRDGRSSNRDETTRPPAQAEHKTRAEDEGEESIDQYMANLMRRLQGIAEIPPEELPSLEDIQPSAVSRQAYLGANHPYRKQEDDESQGEVPKKKPAPRHRPTIESMSTLAAMRELATASANSAITAHTQNRLRKKIRGKLLLSVVAMVLGTVLLMGWMVWGFRGWNIYVGAVGVLLSLVWVIQFAVLTGRLTTTRSGNLSWNAKHPKQTTATPTPPTPDDETNTEQPTAETPSADAVP